MNLRQSFKFPNLDAFFGTSPSALFSPGPSLASSTPIARMAQYVSPTPPIAGLARSSLALGLLLTVLFTPVDQLFFRSQSVPAGTLCGGVAGDLSLFCMSQPHDSPAAKIIAVVILVAVVVGLLPGLTTWLHAWVAWSFQISSPIPDGGDQVGAMVATWLCILYFADTRLTHWSYRSTPPIQPVRSMIRYSGSSLLILQTAVIYGHAFIAKLSVPEWTNATSLWYWIQHPAFRPPQFITEILSFISSSWIGTIGLNYGTLALEASLMLVFLMPRRAAAIVAVIAVVFHIGIALTFGLWSFFCSMLCVVILGIIVPHTNRLALEAKFANSTKNPDPRITQNGG
ncbi:MAG: hypothetical protein ACTIBG_11195 [Brevibacterium aurantiacum]|uniref:hypothetical protein n=1 Tax=Brevibacterium aurantiacum TaxID=273384 RepID=UPI003F8F08FD